IGGFVRWLQSQRVNARLGEEGATDSPRQENLEMSRFFNRKGERLLSYLDHHLAPALALSAALPDFNFKCARPGYFEPPFGPIFHFEPISQAILQRRILVMHLRAMNGGIARLEGEDPRDIWHRRRRLRRRLGRLQCVVRY